MFEQLFVYLIHGGAEENKGDWPTYSPELPAFFSSPTYFSYFAKQLPSGQQSSTITSFNELLRLF